jgi:nucleoside-diphosphate-sugar epimerase
MVPNGAIAMTLAVVTGAPGWLGTSLVAALRNGTTYGVLETEPMDVRCVVQPAVDVTPLDGLGVEVVRADLRDGRALRGCCEGAALVVHAAGIIHPRKIQELFDINVDGTRHMLEEAVAAQSKRFVMVSSNSPAGLNPSAAQLMSEDDPPRPYLAYGLSKLQAEWAVNDVYRSGDLETVIVRPCWFYGPNQPHRQTRFFKMIKGGRPIIVGRGDNLRSMTYIDNAVQGIVLAAHVDAAAGNTYWITDKRPYSMIEIINTVAKVLGVDVRPLYLPSVTSDVARLCDSLVQMTGLYNQEIHVAGELAANIAVSIDAARNDLGFEPTVALEEGMRISIAWCRQAGIDI